MVKIKGRVWLFLFPGIDIGQIQCLILENLIKAHIFSKARQLEEERQGLIVDDFVDGTLQISGVDNSLLTWLEAFPVDRKAKGLAEGTLRFYRQKIKIFSDYCTAQAVKQVGRINSPFLRQFLLDLEESGHNAGGRHAAFRTIRTFFLWYEDEVEPEGWSNPIRKVKVPKLPIEPLEPVSIETVDQMEVPPHQP